MKIAAQDLRHAATIFPSSDWVSQSIMRHVPERKTKIVEFGAGNGSITKAILGHVDCLSEIYAIEINEEFAKQLSEISDARLRVLQGDVFLFADQIEEIVSGKCDTVISGIPFSFFRKDERDKLIELARHGLAKDGRFIAYQTTPMLMPHLRKHFSNCRVYFEPRNLPPFFIMVADNKVEE